MYDAPMARTSERWAFVKEVLDANPGRWVIITRNGHGSWPAHINNGRLAAFRPAGTYEAKMRLGNSVRGTIIARRIPEEEQE